MKHSTNNLTTHAFGLTVMFVMACVSMQGAIGQSKSRTVSLRAGTVIAVKLDTPLSSKDSSSGDVFTATVKDSNSSNSSYALPSGTRIEGVVRQAKPMRDKKPGVLDLTFKRIIFPDGREYSLKGSLIGLDGKNVSRGKDGLLIANKKHKTDRLTYVGYGAGAGLLIGILTHKNDAIRDTAIGAGLPIRISGKRP